MFLSSASSARAAGSVASTSGRTAVPVIARAAPSHHHQQQKRQQQQRRHQQDAGAGAAGEESSLWERAALAASAVALSCTVSWAAPPPIAAAAAQQQQQLSPLAALMADDYLFADADADGRVTAAELARAAERTGRDAGLPSLPEGAASFSARLYDLDGDGALTTDELLRAMALDSAVDPDAGALDAGVLSVFDHDRSGAVSASEWRTALGPVQGGDAVADAVFARADRLTDSRGQLAPEALAAALTAMRAVLLGY